MSLSILATYDDSINANIIRLKLESEGIPCFLNNEHITNLMPHYFGILGSGVQLLVPTDQLDHAREIINLNTGPVACPNCGSADVKNEAESWLNRIKLIFIGLLVAPIGNLLNRYKCQKCGHEFKND